MTSFSSWEQLDRQFRFLISRALPPEYGDGLSLVLTCPKFPDSPIVAALTGFEAVCGYQPGSFIGRNCRFMNRGLKNDPETMSELRTMQESPATARAFMANNPKGKPYLMRNQRPARMASGAAAAVPLSSPNMDEDNCYIEFFNLLHIFGLEVKREKYPKTPVLVGLQFVLTSALNENTAKKLTSEVQDLLMNPHSNIRHVFFDWCRLALSVYEEYSDWNEKGNLNVARRETGETNPDILLESIPPAMPEIDAIQLQLPNSPDTPFHDDNRQDAFRFLPSEEFTLEFPSKSNLPAVSQGEDGTLFTSSYTDETLADSSALVQLKSPRADSRSSLDVSNNLARSTQSEDDKPANGAKQLLEKIKEVETMANEWAKENADEQSGQRVKELVTLREGLCDDFASDLDLYIAFYCVSKELEGERRIVTA